jgi:hypothetical protein
MSIAADAAFIAHDDQLNAELDDLQALACVALWSALRDDDDWRAVAQRMVDRIDALNDGAVRELLARACTARAVDMVSHHGASPVAPSDGAPG